MKEIKTKMKYNPENAIECEDKTMLPPDTIIDGVIRSIEDGIVRGFVKNLEKWTGDHDQPAINLSIEVLQKTEPQEVTVIEQIFTYNLNKEGKTVFNPRSNLGKFKAKYGQLPKVGVQIKIITNSDGFGKVKLE